MHMRCVTPLSFVGEPLLKYNMHIIHMGVTLAELCLLGRNTNTPKWDILATDVAVYFDSNLRKLKLQTYQSISPAKVREKPPKPAMRNE